MNMQNIQESLIKSQLVQQFQSHPSDNARAQDATAATYQQEQARLADEVVIEIAETEETAIRQEQQNQQQQEQQRRKKAESEAEDEDLDEEIPPQNQSSNGHLDITV